MPKRAMLLREDAYPVVGKMLIVEKDEECVEKRDERRHDAHHDVRGLSNHVEKLWHRGLDGVGEVATLQESFNLLLILRYLLGEPG